MKHFEFSARLQHQGRPVVENKKQLAPDLHRRRQRSFADSLVVHDLADFRFLTKVVGSELHLYYCLSTWNPYVVVLMKSRLRIEKTP